MGTFRYENSGNAELLNTSGTTLTVAASKSVTGKAFYGSTSRTDNINTPAGIKEIWFKFDMYIDVAAAKGTRFSFGHYSSSLGGYVGIWNDTSTPAKFLCDAKPRTAINTGLTGTLGKINKIFLHMISDATDGLIELTVNGAAYTFSGNVNNGADFDTLYFYSTTENILFSNIIVSDSAIQAGEGWHALDFDLERKVKNAPLTWRYENPGYADDLLVGSWTQGDLPESQSKTGIAFVNEYRQKCFDLPATNDVWMKFDVYFDGSNRWRAYNDPTGGGGLLNGISAQQTSTSTGILSFFAETNQSIYQGENVTKKNQLQTVLLHMISGSSNGVVEAWVDGTLIYSYTGNVNNGADFADLYLQSDGGDTFFSNVIISNAPIDFAEGWQIFHYDVERTVDKTLELDFDLSRRVKNIVDFELVADVELKYFLPVTLTADLRRNVIRAVEFDADVELLDVIPTEFTADLELKRPIRLKLYPTDTSEYFSGDGVTPVTIPTQKVIPPARDDEATLQSIELVIAEQQITDQVKATGIIPFEIMSVAEGEVLDYVCDMRVERVTQRGILYTCDCCSDIDALLFTQMNYTLPASTTWHKAGEGDTTQEIETHYPPATEHVNKIANALGLTPIMQFDNFLSTVLMDDLGGVTYNDLIRDVFGWSSRVPTMMINVYIRNGKLFVIQRGHEANVIDISDADKTLPTYTRELVRTTWGSTPWSKTETRETTNHKYVPPDKTVKSGGGSSSGGDDSGSGGGSSSGGDDSGDNKESFREASTSFDGLDMDGYTTYSYNLEGLLVQVHSYTHQKSTDDTTDTYVNHSYDDDGTMIRTTTDSTAKTHDADGNIKTTKTYSIDSKSYIRLPNGEKFLASEYTAKYENDELVDEQIVTHSPTRVGQSHAIATSSDGVIGEITGQNTGDDRVTPFANRKAGELARYFFNPETGEWDADNPDNIYWDSDKGVWVSDKGTWETITDNESRTVNGLALYDSSFPIHDEATLIKITKELRRLNRKTRETVTLSVYGLPHVIDFNDRIVLDGNEYFLVSNRLTITARLYNEQTLTLTRWY